MKLKYFELISPFPIKTSIGNIQSPTLKKIWDLGYQTYQSYLNFLLISPETYCNVINPSLKQWYETRLHLNDNVTLQNNSNLILKNNLDVNIPTNASLTLRKINNGAFKGTSINQSLPIGVEYIGSESF